MFSNVFNTSRMFTKNLRKRKAETPRAQRKPTQDGPAAPPGTWTTGVASAWATSGQNGHLEQKKPTKQQKQEQKQRDKHEEAF